MDEFDVDSCFHSDQWICLIVDCGKKLSRKQTLQTHLLCIHSVTGTYTYPTLNSNLLSIKIMLMNYLYEMFLKKKMIIQQVRIKLI